VIGGSRAPYPLVARPLFAVASASAAVAAALAVFVLRPIRRVEVGGDSMRPTLEPGDRLLVLHGPRPRPGDLVTVRDPRDPARILVKRVASVSGGAVTVAGDNPSHSTDSRVFGTLPAASVGGRVVYRYHPEHRRGRPGGR
jgi:nickel-type superoxide dismutase maturation protease